MLNKTKRIIFMSETKLLTEKQISRRKTAAIWLIGAGLLFLALISIAEAWVDNEDYYYFLETGCSYHDEPGLYRLIRFCYPIVSIWCVSMLFISGLLLLRTVAGSNGSRLIRHCLIALIGFVFLQGLLMPVLQGFIVNNIVGEDFDRFTIFLPIIRRIIPVVAILYLLRIFYVVLQNAVDVVDIRNIRLIMSVLLFAVFIICIDGALLTRVYITMFRHYYGYGNIINGMGMELGLLQRVSVIWERGLIGYIIVLSGLGFWGIKGLFCGNLFGKDQIEQQNKSVKSFSFMGIVSGMLVGCCLLAYHIVYWRTFSNDVFGDYFYDKDIFYFLIGLSILTLLVLLFYRNLDRMLLGGKNPYGFLQVILCNAIPWLCYLFIQITYFHGSGRVSWDSGIRLFFLLYFMMIVLYTFYESFLRIRNWDGRLVKSIFLIICSSPMLFSFLLPR